VANKKESNPCRGHGRALRGDGAGRFERVGSRGMDAMNEARAVQNVQIMNAETGFVEVVDVYPLIYDRKMIGLSFSTTHGQAIVKVTPKFLASICRTLAPILEAGDL
jgi:hypothetical protein